MFLFSQIPKKGGREAASPSCAVSEAAAQTRSASSIWIKGHFQTFSSIHLNYVHVAIRVNRSQIPPKATRPYYCLSRHAQNAKAATGRRRFSPAAPEDGVSFWERWEPRRQTC